MSARLRSPGGLPARVGRGSRSMAAVTGAGAIVDRRRPSPLVADASAPRIAPRLEGRHRTGTTGFGGAIEALGAGRAA